MEKIMLEKQKKIDKLKASIVRDLEYWAHYNFGKSKLTPRDVSIIAKSLGSRVMSLIKFCKNG